jgi:nitrogenase iron protein NifH
LEFKNYGEITLTKKPKRIAIYGKGGIGKSTTTSNISAALAGEGFRVIQIGCDPKSDSTNTLRGGSFIPTVLDFVREQNKVKIQDISAVGFNGVLCIEAGGPVPGVGCAGRGINAAVTLLQELHLYEEFQPDVVLFDVLGDVVCGGFAIPIREGIADSVYVVSSADFMAIYAANNLFKCISKYIPSGGARFGGIIANSISSGSSKDIIEDFASKTNTRVMGYVPRSSIISQSELNGKTVIEAHPNSEISAIYRSLAQRIVGNEETTIPQPMSIVELRNWAQDWGSKITLGSPSLKETLIA